MSPTAAAGGPHGPSDPGLAGERTSLAWVRMGLTLIGLPSAIMAYALGHAWVAFGSAAAAAALGIGMLLLSLRSQRAVPGMVEQGGVSTAGVQVLLTTACVLLISVSCMELVLT